MKIQDDVLAGLIELNSRVLDVGCGDGNLLLYLKKKVIFQLEKKRLTKKKIPW